MDDVLRRSARPTAACRAAARGADPVAIVYDVELTLDLPRAETAGTALNALAHCAEALYVRGPQHEGDEQALAGAPLIAAALPRVVADRATATRARSCCAAPPHAGHALGARRARARRTRWRRRSAARYGLPHGAMNALCLPPALEFNRALAPEAVARFGEAIGGDAVERARELARLGGFERLRDFGVPEDDLPRARRGRGSARAATGEPAPATPEEIEAMLLDLAIWCSQGCRDAFPHRAVNNA